MPTGATAAPRHTRATATLWRTVKSSMMTTVGRARPSPRGTFRDQLNGCSSGSSTLFPWQSCPSEARQTPEGVQRRRCDSWQVHSLSSSCHSLLLLLLLLRAALCILKMSHPGCNVNNAEGRPSCWAEAGCPSRLLPYTWGSHTKCKKWLYWG